MDLIQIREMKNKIMDELRRMDGLKQSMEQTLAGLIEWEKHVQDGAVKGAARRRAPAQEIQPKPQAAIKPPDPAPGDRVGRALAAIQGEFTRSQLLAEAEGDGKGAIGSGTYSNIFTRLLKTQRIQCVKGNPGQRDSLYVRGSDKKTRSTDQAYSGDGVSEGPLRG
jgi:hypothetical protein